jgi:hypothetical protein
MTEEFKKNKNAGTKPPALTPLNEGVKPAPLTPVQQKPATPPPAEKKK